MEIQSDLFDGLNLLNNLAQMLESPSEWTRLNSVLRKKDRTVHRDTDLAKREFTSTWDQIKQLHEIINIFRNEEACQLWKEPI